MASKIGCGPLAVLMLIVLLILMIGTNEAIGHYFTNCDDVDLVDCVLNNIEEEEIDEENTVVASGVYTYKDYSVTVTATIPLSGGAVTGTVSGTCEGKVKGTFSGQDNGTISGTMTGVCAPFFVNIPASAEFSGTVNKGSKTVPFGFVGKGAGITHEGSMTLTYP